MTQPVAYVPATSFTSFEGATPTFPGHQIDAELNSVKATTDQVRTNLALIQRDDGKLLNGSVSFDQLDAALTAGGLTPLTAWATATAYVKNQAIVQNFSIYRCAVSHTSGTFASDLASGFWTLLSVLPQGATGSQGISGSPSGRLSLVSGTPELPATSQTGKTTVYWVPYNGRSMPLYDGTNMVLTDLGGELSQTTTDTTKSPAAVVPNSVYDYFTWDDAGTKRCTRGPARSSSTALPDVVAVKGVDLNAFAITNGPAAQRGTWVGTVASDAAGQINFSYGANGNPPTPAILGVWNRFNRLDVALSLQNTLASWTYGAAVVYRVAHGDTTTFRVSFVSGMAADAFYASYVSTMAGDAGSASFPGIGVGYDSTTAPAGGNATATSQSAAANWNSGRAEYDKADVGFHFVVPLEVASAAPACTFYGANLFLTSVFSFRMKM